MDDGHTYNYRQKHQFIHRRFTYKNNELHSKYDFVLLSQLTTSFFCFRSLDSTAKFETNAWIERIVIVGYPKNPKKVTIMSGGKQAIPLYRYIDASKALYIRRPGPSVSSDWTLSII